MSWIKSESLEIGGDSFGIILTFKSKKAKLRKLFNER